MAASIGVDPGCTYLGEFIEENPIPATPTPYAVGQPVRARLVARYVDSWPGDTTSKQFKVLLRDNRIVTVRGHALQYLQNPSNPSDLGSYAVLARAGEENFVVALFRVSEVTGIFSGGLETACASA